MEKVSGLISSSYLLHACLLEKKLHVLYTTVLYIYIFSQCLSLQALSNIKHRNAIYIKFNSNAVFVQIVCFQFHCKQNRFSIGCKVFFQNYISWITNLQLVLLLLGIPPVIAMHVLCLVGADEESLKKKWSVIYQDWFISK